MARSGQVGALAIGEQIECLTEGVLDIGEGRLGDFDVALGLVGLGGQPVLLGAQQVDRDGPGVVGVKQLLALLGELGETLSLASGLGFSLRDSRSRNSPRRCLSRG